MTDDLFDTSVSFFQLRQQWRQFSSFADAAHLWRRTTSARAEKLLKRFRGRIDARTRKLLDEEASAARRSDLPGGTGGWGAVASDAPPSVLLVGQNPYMMPLVPETGTSFSTLSTSDRYFLWLLNNCCRDRNRSQQPMPFGEWGALHGINKVWTASATFLAEVSTGRILNFEAARYYLLEENELRLGKDKKKGTLVTDHLEEVLDAGFTMLGTLLRAGQIGKPQLVIALGKRWAHEFKSLFFDSVPRIEEASHVLVETFHPSTLGKWLRYRQETYIGIACLMTAIEEKKRKANPRRR